MKGWIVREFGGLDAMQYEDLPVPQTGTGQVRVRVHASGMNFAETRMRAGSYSGQELPFIAGMEMAGVVDEVGAGVSGFAVGQRVMGRVRGAHAEYVCIDSTHLFPLPEGLSFEEGAAIPVGWLTAWHAVHTVGELAAGKRVLIEAVASSVGSAALQIAKQRGCWVAGTASRDDKLVRAKAWGLDVGYNYKRENIAERVMADTGGQGVDVGLMTIGEETATMLFDSMGMGGRVIMYGSTGGRQVCFSLNIGVKKYRTALDEYLHQPAVHARDDVHVPRRGFAAVRFAGVQARVGRGAALVGTTPCARDDRRANALREDCAQDRLIHDVYADRAPHLCRSAPLP